MYKYIQGREEETPKRTLQRLKQKSLSDLEQPEFRGTSFDVLIRVMNYYEITFELFCQSESVVKNDENAECKLVTASFEKCEKLQLALSPLDAYPLPDALKKPGAERDSFSSYVMRLDQVIFSLEKRTVIIIDR